MAFLDNEQIGKRLITKREETKHSSRKFAMLAGVDASQYSKIEKGELPITENILEKLASYYNLDKNFILYGKNVPHETNNNNKDFMKLTVDSVPDNPNLTNKMLFKLIESLHQLVENDKIKAEAEKIRAENDRVLTKSHEDVIALLKTRITERSHQQMSPELEARFSEILELIAEIGAGKRWASKTEAIEELNKYVLFPGK